MTRGDIGRALALLVTAVVLLAGRAAPAAAAIDEAVVHDLAFGESDARLAAIAAIAATGDARAKTLLQAMRDGNLQTAGERQVLVVDGDDAIDAATGQRVSPLPGARDDIVVNNRVRKALEVALASFDLGDPDRAVRLRAARQLQDGADDAMLPSIERALAAERDTEVRLLLAQTRASIELASPSKATRLAAIRELATSDNPATRSLLAPLVARNGDAYAEADAEIRAAAATSLRAIDARLARAEMIGRVFSGVSLGSILLLAALGLAVTYGLMGVINMAHGELIMIGAYATFVVQNLFRRYAPGAFDAYLVVAIPVAFAAAALVGMALERSVIRFLYGRPLETLLATFGASLVLMQGVRTLFGAQNVQVENPSWMSGGFEVAPGVVLPWNRIGIIVFAALVLAAMGALLARTRLGLFVRAVTQNRAMASCNGVPTRRVDTLAFGLGAGIAGLAGCALSQVGNVGPDLGQGYIVDSFMVVVLGGVGQLAGTVYAALGLGIVDKFLEAWSGAVLAKIAVLAFIIVFIQKRPQGLFALKGRFADA